MPIFDPLSVFDPRQLHESIELGEIEYLKSLLKFGIYVNKRGTNGRTALHVAVFYGKSEIAKLLLEHGVDPDEKNTCGRTALHVAIERFDKTTVQVLLDYGAQMIEYNEDNLRQIHIAAACGDVSVINQLLSLEIDLEEKYNWMHESLLTALHLAAIFGHREIIENLLEEGAKYDPIYDKHYKTCILHSAALGGDIEIVKLFMELGCDIHERYTILHFAARGTNPEMIKFLLRQGIDINVKDNVGENALFSAAGTFSSVNESVIRLLLNLGIGINETNEWGKTPLDIAVNEIDVESVKMLLKFGAAMGPTLLLEAHSHKNVVSLLLNHGADVNQKDSDGKSALFKIVARQIGEFTNLEATLEELINHGAEVATDNSLLWKFVEVDDYNTEGVTLATNDNYFRSLRGNKGIVKRLLQHGANVNFRNEQGISVFEHALHSNCFHRAFIQPFLDFGLAINDYYGSGKSIVQFTLDQGEHLFAKVITRHVVKVKHQKRCISAENLENIRNNEELHHFWEDCEAEITKMKAKEGFYNLFVSQSLIQLAKLASQRGMERIFASQHHTTMFPIYADHLEQQFEEGARTAPLLRDVINFFHAVADSEGNEDLPKLPDTCISKIFEFFETKDFETLAYVCNPRRR